MRTLLTLSLLLALPASGPAAEPDKPKENQPTVEFCWVDWDDDGLVNHVDIVIRYEKPAPAWQVQVDMFKVIERECEGFAHIDYEHMPLCQFNWNNTEGTEYGLFMMPVLTDGDDSWMPTPP